MAYCRGKSLLMKSVIYGQNTDKDGNTMIVHGKITLEFDGVTAAFSIPHTLGSLPDDVSVTTMDTTDVALTQRVITFDANQIVIDFLTPPTIGEVMVCWQVFKG